MIRILAVFALDRPEFSVVGFGDDVDALVGGWQLEFAGDGLRHLALKPDMLELAGVFRFELEVGFDELLEEIAFSFFGKVAPPRMDVMP